MTTRLRTLEAMALLLAARFLVRFVPLSRWRGLLGQTGADDVQANRSENSGPGADETVRYCVAAIRRGSYRLPGSICLPQAIALQWMLARRRLNSTLTIGFLPHSQRGTRDDLHAWVSRGDTIILGDSGGKHSSLMQFRTNM